MCQKLPRRDSNLNLHVDFTLSDASLSHYDTFFQQYSSFCFNRYERELFKMIPIKVFFWKEKKTSSHLLRWSIKDILYNFKADFYHLLFDVSLKQTLIHFNTNFTGTTVNRERCPYVFMANSQSEMEEWVRALRRVIGVPTSGGSV